MGRRAHLTVLLMRDPERVDLIGRIWIDFEGPSAGELLIDCEEDRTLRAGASGCLREADC
jgi:hypothetical protein